MRVAWQLGLGGGRGGWDGLRAVSARAVCWTMQVLSHVMDDALTNLNWLVCQNPIAPLSPSTPPTSPSPSLSSASSGPDYTRERIKPPYSYAQLIIMAMQAHGSHKVLLTDIYSWIRLNFAYFRGNDTSWQNSVRHNLSLNKQFVKVPREQMDKGKGSYWKLDTAQCTLTKDPYCLRRRNFTDNGSSSRRVHRPAVSRPQVNPAIKAFLDRVRSYQESKRHPFAGTGETLEDIGAQECVYADTEPLFDDFNRKLFKKDVQLYDPNGCCPRGRWEDLNEMGLTPLDDGEDEQGGRDEGEWETDQDQQSSAAAVQLPLEGESVRLDLRIPTPDWWSTTASTHNLLLSPSNGNPIAKMFENMGNSFNANSVNIISPDHTVEGLISIPSPGDPDNEARSGKVDLEQLTPIHQADTFNRATGECDSLMFDLE